MQDSSKARLKTEKDESTGSVDVVNSLDNLVQGSKASLLKRKK